MSHKHITVNGQKRHINGWVKQRPDHRDHVYGVFGPDQESIPAQADLSQFCNPAPNQLDLGSCVANATTSAMEWLYKKDAKTPVDFSRLFVYFYARRAGHFPVTEDTGCNIRDAFKVIHSIGACFEETWPYDEGKFSVAPSYQAIKEARHHESIEYIACPDLTSIKHSIGVRGFPAVGGFSVPANMDSEECARTGIVKYPEPNETMIGGHAVFFVGYDDSVKLLKFQNSWSENWGLSGMGFLPYSFIENGLADDFWTLHSIHE